MSLEDRIKEAKDVLNSLGSNLSLEDQAKLQTIKETALGLAKDGDLKGLDNLRDSLSSKLNQDAK